MAPGLEASRISRSIQMAEREGFEPPDLSVNGFQDRRHKPLGHLSNDEDTGGDIPRIL